MRYPLLPLRNFVVFPDCLVPIYVGRATSLAALQLAHEQDSKIVVCSQRDPSINDPTTLDALSNRGTICSILRQTNYSGSQSKVIIFGESSCELQNVNLENNSLWVDGKEQLQSDFDVITDDVAEQSYSLLIKWYAGKMDEDTE